jgi:glycosyltransferase involved in cell wall biosynthesis
VEAIVVVDWQPKRHDRPRLIAVPLSSGAGQYRVIEPLNALQDANLAQTCVVLPPYKNVSRILQPLELIRAAPDRLILQHSVDDAQLGLTEKYRLVMPDLEIIQMVDDLLGDVPIKHPNRNFQTREGHQRMIQALKQSDILVVTTEPLRTNYQKYVKDVRLVPNALGQQWTGLRKVPDNRTKLRVGWVGAAQHKGDLDLIAEVVREMATEVDWVFMGMCTDEIKPHLKEFHGFVSISEYPQKVSELDLDIAIAPLENNIFNECKSNLRLLEYGAMGWPVVCSDVYPYRADAPPVIRCSDDVEEWVGALRKLVADKELRLNMGSQLHEWVSTKYLLDGMVTKWSDCLLT